MRKLVSIITPCYNGEKFIKRFLDSIIDQTYEPVELIFVNDGSTDQTEEIVLGYQSAFEKRGIKFIYRSQPNAGQAAALNEGLKWFTGEFLTWPDSDDWLESSAIEKRVNFLESHSKYGFVRSNAWYVDYTTLKNTRRVSVLPKRRESKLFEGLLKGTQYWVPGCYLVRTSAFLNVNPKRSIENSFVGQNVQMLLPLAYKYLCGYMDECLYYYVNTPNSHSRVRRTYMQACERCDEFYRLLDSTCNKIEMEENERKKYSCQVDEYWFFARRNLALQYKQIEDFKRYEMLYRKKYGAHRFIPLTWIYVWKGQVNEMQLKCKNIVKQVIR